MSKIDFTRLAHRSAVLAKLRQYAEENLIRTEGAAKEVLICEDVFYMDREVTQDAILDVLAILSGLEARMKLQMSEYELRRLTEDDDGLDGSSSSTSKPGKKPRAPSKED